MTGPDETHLGTFEVSTDGPAVAAFRAATGLRAEDTGVPLTFPIRWLALPEVRAVLNGLVTERDLVLIHESQSFAYERPLRLDEPYALNLAARREGAPDRLVAEASIVAADGSLCVTLETVLRLFSTVTTAAA